MMYCGTDGCNMIDGDIPKEECEAAQKALSVTSKRKPPYRYIRCQPAATERVVRQKSPSRITYPVSTLIEKGSLMPNDATLDLINLPIIREQEVVSTTVQPWPSAIWRNSRS
jgi:hypothetical protein